MTQTALPLAGTTLPPIRQAFDASTLRDQGYTFEQAISIPLVRKALQAHARAITEPRKA